MNKDRQRVTKYFEPIAAVLAVLISIGSLWISTRANDIANTSLEISRQANDIALGVTREHADVQLGSAPDTLKLHQGPKVV